MGAKGLSSVYKSGAEAISAIPTGRRSIAFDSVIEELDLDPKKTPLIYLLEKVKKESVDQLVYNWYSESRRPDWIAPASTFFGGDWKAGAAATGTIIVADADAYLMYPSQIVRVPSVSALNIIITNAGSSGGGFTTFNAQTVSGSNINLSAANASNLIYLIGDAFEIGSGMGTIITTQPTQNYNYIQIVQTPIGITEEMTSIGMEVGGDEYARQKKLAAIYHQLKLEKIAWFGERKLNATGVSITGVTGAGTYAQYFTGGVRSSITTNVTSSVGALDVDEFDTFVTEGARYADQPVIFCGELIAKGVRKWLKTDYTVNVNRTESVMGLSVMKYQTYDGKIVPIVPCPELFKEDLAGECYSLDMSDIKYKYLKGFDTRLELDLQENEVKQKIDEFRTYFGMKVGNEARHARMDGVTSIA